MMAIRAETCSWDIICIWQYSCVKTVIPSHICLPLSPVTFLKFQMASILILLMSSGSKKEQPRYTCLSEAKASQLHWMWAEVSSSAPHLVHNGLSDSPIRWRCLLRVLCPVRRPVPTLDCAPLKERNLALAPGQGPVIHSQGCLLSITKTSPLYPKLVNRTTSNPTSHILPGDSQSWLRSNKPLYQRCLLQTCWWFCFLVPQCVQGTNTAPLLAG